MPFLDVMQLSIFSIIYKSWPIARFRATVVSWDFNTFMVFHVLAGVPTLTHRTIGPSGWSFKYNSVWSSPLVHLAKVVLPNCNLICWFNIPFFPTKPAACGYRRDGFFIQYHGLLLVLNIMTFEMYPNHHLVEEGICTWYSASLVPSDGKLG